MSLGLKWVSCRQHIYGSCSCIHLASLLVLVGEFNPFTLKVIIDMYVPITIFLIVLGLVYVGLCVFLASRSSFSIWFIAGLVVVNSLNICLSVQVLISL